MNTNEELNLECNLNIDLECEPDDDSEFQIRESREIKDIEEDNSGKTGIIINFNDDDDDLLTSTLKTTPRKHDMFATNFYNSKINDEEISHFDRYNDPYAGIDMNCDVYDEDEEVFDKELVDEEMLEEKRKKKSISTAQAESNYLAKLQKQHQKTITKGAMGLNFHIGGDPEKDAAFFNHANGVDAAGTASTAATASAGGGGGGMGESLHKQLLDEALLIIGFDVVENSDHSYSAIDTCDSQNDFQCKDKAELYNQLKPYIDDCFILPLQIATGEKFENCKEWADWYTSDNMKKFPKCASDINYCRAIAKQFEE